MSGFEETLSSAPACGCAAAEDLDHDHALTVRLIPWPEAAVQAIQPPMSPSDAPLKHLAYAFATFVADYVKHVSDLEVAQALHQRGKQKHAEQKQSSDR